MEEQHDVRKLTGLDDWQLEDDDQDLRGKMLRTSDGRDVGVVDDMLADLDAERIAALRLEDGRIVNIDAVDIQDEEPVLLADGAGVAPAPEGVGRDGVTTEHIPLVEERMIVGKRKVDLGKVRISTRVVSEDVGEDVTLRSERVHVDRRPVDNERLDADAADALFQDNTIELRETGEEVVVTKDAVVTGEVVVEREVEAHDERVEGKVRRTEVDVARDGQPRRPADR